MARTVAAARIERLSVGDFDLRHPTCRTPVLIVDVQHGQRRTLFTAICQRCDTYVYLAFHHDDDPFRD